MREFCQKPQKTVEDRLKLTGLFKPGAPNGGALAFDLSSTDLSPLKLVHISSSFPVEDV